MPYSWYAVTSGLEEIMAQMCGVEESVPETLLFLLSTLSPFYSFSFLLFVLSFLRITHTERRRFEEKAGRQGETKMLER